MDLATGEILSVGIKEPKKAVEKPAQIRKQNAFYRVVAAAKRLLDVVYKNEGLANKELMKFENQINNLADKPGQIRVSDLARESDLQSGLHGRRDKMMPDV